VHTRKLGSAFAELASDVPLSHAIPQHSFGRGLPESARTYVNGTVGRLALNPARVSPGKRIESNEAIRLAPAKRNPLGGI
jgi:hypothetical protein